MRIRFYVGISLLIVGIMIMAIVWLSYAQTYKEIEYEPIYVYIGSMIVATPLIISGFVLLFSEFRSSKQPR